MQLVEKLRKFYEDERCFLYVRHDGVTEGPRDDGPVMKEDNRTTGDETVSVLIVVLDEAVPGRFVLRNSRLDCVVEENVLLAGQAGRL